MTRRRRPSSGNPGGTLAEARARVERWKSLTILLGLAMLACAAGVLAFFRLPGLAPYFAVARVLAYVAMALFSLFMLAALLTANFWWQWRSEQRALGRD